MCSKGSAAFRGPVRGVLIPCEEKAAEVFKRMFLQGTPEEVEEQVRRAGAGPEHPRRGGGPGEELAAQRRARATASGSINISPACAIWNSGWQMSREWERKPKPEVKRAGAARSGQSAEPTWRRCG